MTALLLAIWTLSNLLKSSSAAQCLQYTDPICANQNINTNNLICWSAYSCMNAQITLSEDLECRGYESCYWLQSVNVDNMYCTGDLSCNAIQDNSINVNGNLYCDGYQGCRYCTGITGLDKCSSVSINSGTPGTFYVDNNVYSRGYYSAVGAKIQAQGTAFFYGDYSGYYAEITTGGNIYCYGRLSCYYGDLTTSNGDVYSHGYQSAYRADISASKVYSYGYYSTGYTEISANFVYLRGYFSGYYADINCRYNQICSVTCQCNACYKTDIYYWWTESSVTLSPANCKDYQGSINPDGVYCPTLIKKLIIVTSASVPIPGEQTPAHLPPSDEEINEFNEYKKQREKERENDPDYIALVKEVENDLIEANNKLNDKLNNNGKEIPVIPPISPIQPVINNEPSSSFFNKRDISMFAFGVLAGGIISFLLSFGYLMIIKFCQKSKNSIHPSQK